LVTVSWGITTKLVYDDADNFIHKLVVELLA